jgi:hypothetical protein
MPKYSGFVDLQTPIHLFHKLERNLERMKEDPLSTDAAFDFFVTATHMPEWAYRSKPLDLSRVKSEPLHQLSSHLGDGAKHFEATNPKHQSVKATEHHKGAFSSAFSSGFDIDQLIVRLDGTAKKKFGDSIGTIQLAEQILAFWKTELNL